MGPMSNEDDGKLVRDQMIDELLRKAEKTALTKRQHAWLALKQTRNPLYVAMRYGYSVEIMEKALEKIPESKTANRQRSKLANSARSRDHGTPRASELLPEFAPRSRQPGEDDDLE